MLRRHWQAVVWGVWTLCAPAWAAEGARLPRAPMPEAAAAGLRDALERSAMPEAPEKSLERNRAALELLLELDWPDFRVLERGELLDPKKPADLLRVWRAGSGGSVLLASLAEKPGPEAAGLVFRPLDFELELAELFSELDAKGEREARPTDFTFLEDWGRHGWPMYEGAFFLQQAFAAAVRGQAQAVPRLVREALRRNPHAFEGLYEQLAWNGFLEGVDLLEAGAARQEVLALWRGVLGRYPRSRYTEQLTEYTELLQKQQMEREPSPGAAPLEADEALEPVRRAAALIEGFPDVHGMQLGQPGRCQLLGLPPGTGLSDAVVGIGRPAVPPLIEHLRDRRLTRSIGFWRNFAPSRSVLRVQDVSLACIEAILDVQFYKPRGASSNFSDDPPELREKLIAEIEQWWDENGQASPLDGLLARLEVGNVRERIRNLERIEAIPGNGVDSAAVLKRWWKSAKDLERSAVFEALAERGDLSLLPELRRSLRDAEPFSLHLSQYLALYGGAEDYRLLLEVAGRSPEHREALCRAVFPTGLDFGPRNRFAPLLLAELLDQRRLVGQRSADPERLRSSTPAERGMWGLLRLVGLAAPPPPIGMQDFSCADLSVEVLIRLTGHNEGYDPAAASAERFAAMDRWLAWWSAAGRPAYLEAHPGLRLATAGKD